MTQKNHIKNTTVFIDVNKINIIHKSKSANKIKEVNENLKVLGLKSVQEYKNKCEIYLEEGLNENYYEFTGYLE